MKKEFTPIAMHCNKEQFEAIKPKLKGVKIGCVSNFNEWNYLVNNEYGDHFVICNTGKSGSKRYNREIHETWNERIFLNACGIETEETFEITKEQILELSKESSFTNATLNKWFPEVFSNNLVNNTWYVCHHYSSRYLVNLTLTDESDTHNKGFGFDSNEKWNNNLSFLKTHDYRFKKATEQEVFEALKNEAVRRGFGEKCLFDFEGVTYYALYGNNFTFYDFELQLQEGVVFANGNWATIIPTKTKEEAEKLLGVKIID